MLDPVAEHATAFHVAVEVLVVEAVQDPWYGGKIADFAVLAAQYQVHVVVKEPTDGIGPDVIL